MEPICNCHSIEFIPIDEQPATFAAALDPDERARLIAACESVAEAFAVGRPHGSRTAMIGSAILPGLFELRIVWPGLPEPQLRLLCMRSGSQVLVARGFVQPGNRVPPGEVELAEQAILRFWEQTDEPRVKGTQG